MAKQKRRFIELDWADPDALRAQDIPYDATVSIKSKIDGHVAASAPHPGVVKTIDDQSIGGVKTFTQFPVTPSSNPSSDYEVANKQYVDGKTGGNIEHGDLSGLANDDHPQYLLKSGNINQISSRDHDQLDGLGDDDHTQYLTVSRHDSLNHSPVASSIPHNSLNGITQNDHHNQIHAINGPDHTGDLAYQQIDSIVDTSGGGSSNMISGAQHVHTGSDGSSQVSHGNLSGVSANQHHTEFTPTQHDSRDHSAVASTFGLSELGSKNHSELANVSANQHHSQQHSLGGSDHTGDLSWGQIDSLVDTSGGGGSSQLNRANHGHTGSDGSSQISHGNLSGVSANQHHAKFDTSDHDARDHSAVAGTIALSELGSRAHNQLTSIGANDHHQAFTPANHSATDHTGIPGVGKLTFYARSEVSIKNGSGTGSGTTTVNLSSYGLPSSAKAVQFAAYATHNWNGGGGGPNTSLYIKNYSGSIYTPAMLLATVSGQAGSITTKWTVLVPVYSSDTRFHIQYNTQNNNGVVAAWQIYYTGYWS